MKARRLLTAAALLAAAILLPACIETRDVITLNPDGSGKAQLDMTRPSEMGLGMGGPASAPAGDGAKSDAAAKEALSSLIRDTKGVDAWSDVSYTVGKDGKVNLKATAYFADVTKFKAGPSMPISWTKSDKGGMVLTLKPDEADGPASQPATPPTQEEIDKRVAEMKKDYQQNKPFMGMVFGTLRLETTYVLPGTVTESNGFTKTNKGLQLVIEGKKVIDATDKLMNDEKAIAENMKAGRKADQPNMADIFGTDKPLMARATADKPAFDYKAEMQKAKDGQDAMFKKLGIDAAALKGPPMGMPMEGGTK